MTKLLQAIAGAKYGGAEAFFVRLAIALEKAGVKQNVVIRHNTFRSKALRDVGIKPLELRFGGKLDIFTKFKLKNAIKEFRPDIVFTWMNRATIKMPKGPFVHIARLGGYYNLKYYRHCDYLVANTPSIVNHITSSGWPSTHVQYIPNFVNSLPGRLIDREALNTPADVPVIIALGRFHRNKAFDILIRALKDVPDVVLWLAGDGPLKTDLQFLASEVGLTSRIRFLGWREDFTNLIASADILICPSRHEPLGNVILEAWAQKKPVIAAASDGPKHLIADGTSGLLCPIDDYLAMGRAVNQIINSPDTGKCLGEAGYTTFQNKFTEESVVSKYLNFFQSIAL